jgi:hypothetical protein
MASNFCSYSFLQSNVVYRFGFILLGDFLKFLVVNENILALWFRFRGYFFGKVRLYIFNIVNFLRKVKNNNWNLINLIRKPKF